MVPVEGAPPLAGGSAELVVTLGGAVAAGVLGLTAAHEHLLHSAAVQLLPVPAADTERALLGGEVGLASLAAVRRRPWHCLANLVLGVEGLAAELTLFAR
jgi:hypothetical protein